MATIAVIVLAFIVIVAIPIVVAIVVHQKQHHVPYYLATYDVRDC